jgi:hypothetical protein
MSAARISTALIPATPPEAALVPPANSRPRADFLAQLIATSAQVPQTRLRRRAESDEAIAAYGASDRSPTLTGESVRRSL